MLEKQGTNLPLMQEIAYNIMKSNSPFANDSGFDYDLRGYYLKYGTLNPTAANGHLSDEFKYYHHPTFSTESRYYTGQPYAVDWSKEPLKQYGEYRQPYQSELDYFKNNKHVGGMATEDNKIILNPYSNLNDKEKQQVGLNEGVRLFLRENPNYVGNFGLTKQQQANLGNYSNDINDIRSTILARILTNDPSVGEPTLRQRFNAYRIKNAINEK